ncbi:MAG: HAMP domain-containing histidine kinase [Rhizobiaceae bacterium]|nr:HAMP domain-containing histidine kinase [Rhizobiaceae bacterium]
MSEQATKTHDKTIVERRVIPAGAKSRQAVKALRASSGGRFSGRTKRSSGFEADLLSRHARVQKSTLALALMVLVMVCVVGQFFLAKAVLGVWLAVGVGLVGVGYRLAATYLQSDPEEQIASGWERNFVILRVMTGLHWAALFVMLPTHNSDGNVSTVLLFAMLVICGQSLLQSRFLKFGTLLDATPSAIIFSYMLLKDMSFAYIVATACICTTLAFFQVIAETMRNGSISNLKARAERDQLVMELEHSRSISDEARRRAEESNLAKSRFLATMSHELRTPLNAILGFSEVMTNEVMGPIDNAHYKEYLGDIHRSGSHLLKLINEILDLSRVEAGRYELNEEATNLAHAADESQQMMKLKAAEKNVTVVTQIQPDLPQLWADARAVRQVILNLLSNALKFTPSGGTIWLKVGWTAGGGQYISVRDTGPGIPEEEIPIVLSSFGQGSIAIKSAEQGTGLGLPIVQALVHMHEGSFDLKSKLREGTEVIATFPKSRVMEELPVIPVEGQKQSRFPHMRRRVQAPSMAAQ